MTETLDSTATPRDLVNLRDLGGIAVRGGRVRPGLVWRSDDAACITDTGAATLVERGLTTLIDLRSADELTLTGRGPLGTHPVLHHHLPLLDLDASPVRLREMIEASGDTSQTVGAWYAHLALDRAEVLVAGLRVVAEAPGAVLFHCAAGKDRTGIFAAALLTALGAALEDIAADYALTHAAMPQILARLSGQARPWEPEGGLIVNETSALLGAPAATMRHMLEVLDIDHGGFAAVLAAGGLDPRLRNDLVDRLVVESR